MSGYITNLQERTSAVRVRFHLLDVDARVAEEVNRVCGGREPCAADLPQLEYTRRVLLEVMRLYPPLWIMGRMPTRDVEVGGYRLPRGSVVLLSQFVTHRHPEFWENPEGFDPDRFLPEHIRARPAHAYKPFGTGERACIGRQFALHESVIVLAKLLHRFDLTPEPGYELTITERLTLMPVGFRVGLTRR